MAVEPTRRARQPPGANGSLRMCGWTRAQRSQRPFVPTTLLPEDALDSQPFVDHELIFVCRARLDDRAGLLQQLQIDSARGATLSDAHIVRHCYKKWREETPGTSTATSRS